MQTRILAALVVLSLVSAGCAKKDEMANATDTSAASMPAAASDHSADRAAILAADSAWLRHVVAKNVDSLMTYYAPDVVSYGFGAAPATGLDQLRASYTEMVKSAVSNPKVTPGPVNFSDDGTMAFDHGIYTLTVTPPGGKTSTDTGGYLNVWKKMDGQWKMVAEMSTPVTPSK